MFVWLEVKVILYKFYLKIFRIILIFYNFTFYIKYKSFK